MSTRCGIGGRFLVTITVVLGNCLGVSAAHAQNTAPSIGGTPPAVVATGYPYYFRPLAYDAEGDKLTFSASGLPRWARFDKRTGRVSGSPSSRDVGTAGPITITVSDGRLSGALPAFKVAVVLSQPPSISGVPSTAAREKELYGFQPAASDPEGDALTFSIANKPAWATFQASTGLLSGIPSTGTAGTYSNIQISVSDGSSRVSLPAFSITVAAGANSAPTIYGIPPTTAASGQIYSFKPTASDPDGQTLKFSIAGLPAWATFDTATGALTGTPSSTQAGTYSNIVISVSDGLASASMAPFSITVTTTNTAPTISGSSSTSVTVGQLYSFTPTASDKEGQKLTFSIANKPAWATFDSVTGRLSGTPASANVGTFSNIVISVSDGQLSASLAAFSLTVKSGTLGSATLSWVPPTQNVDGTPVTNLAGFRIAYGQSATSLTQMVDIPSATVTSAVIESLASGTWYFAVKAYSTANVESDLSNLAQKTIY